MKRKRAWLQASAALLGCLSLCACSLRLPIEPYREAQQPAKATAPSSEAAAGQSIPVWLVADEYHSGMAFDYAWLVESGFVPPEDFPDCHRVMMSWGNTDAYSKQGISGIAKVMRVLFTPTPSVMEMIPFNRHVTKIAPNQRVLERHYHKSNGRSLAHFLNQCVSRDAMGRPIVVRPSTWGNGVQMQGRYSYFIPRVCNIWSAQAVEALGGEINALRATSANGLIRQLKKPANGYIQIGTHDLP